MSTYNQLSTVDTDNSPTVVNGHNYPIDPPAYTKSNHHYNSPPSPTKFTHVDIQPASDTLTPGRHEDIHHNLFAGYDNVFHAIKESAEARTILKQSAIEIASLSWPIVLSYVLQFGLNSVNVMFLGHLDSQYLAASALSNMLVNVTGYSLIMGLATSVDTLASQAYGAKNYQQMTLISLRATIFLLLCCIPVVLVWTFAEPLLLLAGQSPDIAALGGMYCKRMIFGIIPVTVYEVLKKWCQAQRIVHLFLYIGVAANIFNICVCYTFIIYFGWGFTGAPLAVACSQWFMLLLAIYLIRRFGYAEKSWPSKLTVGDLFRGWKQLIVLGVPGMAMICMEWWAFEIMSLVAGWLGTVQVDAFIVSLNIISMCYTVPLGVGISASTVVGNLLGAGSYSAAKLASLCAVILAAMVATFNLTMMMLFRHSLGSIFSNDEAVIASVAASLPLFAFDSWVEGIQGTASGILRGAGKQKIGAMANLIGYWIVCLPIALLTALKLKWGVSGLITGLCCGVMTTLLIYTFSLARLDWRLEAEKAQIRAAEEQRQLDSAANMPDGVTNGDDAYDKELNGSADDLHVELAKIDARRRGSTVDYTADGGSNGGGLAAPAFPHNTISHEYSPTVLTPRQTSQTYNGNGTTSKFSLQ